MGWESEASGNLAVRCYSDFARVVVGRAVQVRCWKCPIRHARSRGQKLGLLVHGDQVFPRVNPATRMSALQVSTGVALASFRDLKVLIAVLMQNTSGGTIVTVLAIRQAEVLLRGAQSQLLCRLLEWVSLSQLTDVLRNWVMLLDEFID